MRAKLYCVCFTTAESRVKIWPVKLFNPHPTVASVAVRSNTVVLLLFIHGLLLLPLFVGVKFSVFVLFCSTLCTLWLRLLSFLRRWFCCC